MENHKRYPRTVHVPWSMGRTSDDISIIGCSCFDGKEVVVSEKIDGECTSIYPDGYVHARSPDSKHHISRSWIKSFAQTIVYKIPKDWRVCGENLTAFHSIYYVDLPTYFFVIGIYDENDNCLDWDTIEECCREWGLITVPVIYRGVWDEKLIRELWTGKGAFPTFESEKTHPEFPVDFKSCEAEGYVIRLAESFPYNKFQSSCSKYVRRNHVKTDSHWAERFIPNKLLS